MVRIAIERDHPTVTVIVPAFNAACTIREALDSVCVQTMRSIEIIVVDDGSTDSTPEVLRDAADRDGRIRVFRKENGGVSSARNLGLAEARGTWVAFLDADDRMAPDYLQSLLDAAALGTDVVIAGATIERNGRKEPCVNSGEGILKRDGIRDLEMQILDEEPHGANPCSICILGCICSKLFKKSLLHDIRFDERVGMREDAIFNLEVLSRARSVAVSKSCGYFYLSEGESASLRFHLNFDSEVDAFLEDCKAIWNREGLSEESYHRGVLYTYMSWLKLYALHPQSGFSRAQEKSILRGSFNDPRWQESFAALSGEQLGVPYALLKLAYERRSVALVTLLKVANDVKRGIS